MKDEFSASFYVVYISSLSFLLCFDNVAWRKEEHPGSLSCGSLQFLGTNISQGSVWTCLRCGRMFNCCFPRNLVLSLWVKHFKN